MSNQRMVERQKSEVLLSIVHYNNKHHKHFYDCFYLHYFTNINLLGITPKYVSQGYQIIILCRQLLLTGTWVQFISAHNDNAIVQGNNNNANNLIANAAPLPKN